MSKVSKKDHRGNEVSLLLHTAAGPTTVSLLVAAYFFEMLCATRAGERKTR